jgi:hypothetical protein
VKIPSSRETKGEIMICDGVKKQNALYFSFLSLDLPVVGGVPGACDITCLHFNSVNSVPRAMS